MLPAPLAPFLPSLSLAAPMWILAALLMLIDFYRLHRRRASGKSAIWYASSLLWFSACSFPFGLALAALPFLPGSALLFFLAFFLTLLPLTAGIVAIVYQDSQALAQKEGARVRQLAETHPRMVTVSNSLVTVPAESMLIIMGVLVVSYAITDLLKPYFSSVLLLLMLLLILIGTFVSVFYTRRFTRRINQRKAVLAAANEENPLVQGLSQEPVQGVFPPLKMRFKGTALAGYLMLAVVFCLIYLYPLDAGSNFSIAPILFPLFYLPVAIFHLLRSLSERIETTTQGLTVTRGIWFARQTQHIPWQNVRLFTCYPAYGFWKSRTRISYELSGPGRAVQWMRLVKSRSSWSLWKPVLPGDEYDQRHQELCAFISRQTGLPLHNLDAESQPAREEKMMMQTRRRG